MLLRLTQTTCAVSRLLGTLMVTVWFQAFCPLTLFSTLSGIVVVHLFSDGWWKCAVVGREVPGMRGSMKFLQNLDWLSWRLSISVSWQVARRLSWIYSERKTRGKVALLQIPWRQNTWLEADRGERELIWGQWQGCGRSSFVQQDNDMERKKESNFGSILFDASDGLSRIHGDFIGHDQRGPRFWSFVLFVVDMCHCLYGRMSERCLAAFGRLWGWHFSLLSLAWWKWLARPDGCWSSLSGLLMCLYILLGKLMIPAKCGVVLLVGCTL